MTLIGVITLGAGYTIALSIEDQSLPLSYSLWQLYLLLLVHMHSLRLALL